jgi:DNA polymerase-3 subunit epsilon
MADQTEWVILDTETTGLCAPIYTVELAAQRMRGIEKDGAPFRVFLNHDVPIPRAAYAIHGYSREFLAERGIDPIQAHEQLRRYVGSRFVVAHHVSYDWNAVLLPEWHRLQIPQIGKGGFCSCRLARRVIHECKSHSLDPLRERFDLPNGAAHSAIGDTETVYLLLSQVIFPRLERIGLTTYSEFARFCEQKVAKCHCLVQGLDYEAMMQRRRAERQKQKIREFGPPVRGN